VRAFTGLFTVNLKISVTSAKKDGGGHKDRKIMETDFSD
jgi:hypothetical protein